MKKAVKKAVSKKRKPAPKAPPAKKKPTTKPKPTKKVKAKTAKKTAPKSKPAAKKTPAPKSASKPKPVAPPKPVLKAPPVALPKIPPAPVAPPPPPRLSGSGQGTRDNPWVLQTPSGNSEFQAFRDEHLDPPALVVWVGSTELRYHMRCLTDLQAMLKNYGDWMLLGSADEQQAVDDETVEAWGRSPFNPIGGWYGLKAGLRGRLAMYLPPILEFLGLAEVEHFPKNNRMRAK
jgi:hypothetical protein